MLDYYETKHYYTVVEKILGWRDTKTTVVRYTKDLTKLQVNDYPWRPMSEKDVIWFEKYYKKRCEANKVEVDYDPK